MASTGTIISLLAMAGAAAGCAADVGHAPVARIAATPRAILDHDSFATDVVLDGSASGDPIDDPTGARPLAYQWELQNDEVRVQAGNFFSPSLTARFLGSRPPTVYLTVTDEDGESATARLQLQLTITR